MLGTFNQEIAGHLAERWFTLQVFGRHFDRHKDCFSHGFDELRFGATGGTPNGLSAHYGHCNSDCLVCRCRADCRKDRRLPHRRRGRLVGSTCSESWSNTRRDTAAKVAGAPTLCWAVPAPHVSHAKRTWRYEALGQVEYFGRQCRRTAPRRLNQGHQNVNAGKVMA